jgi:poly(3-hydroxybutyrate) depolymerase
MRHVANLRPPGDQVNFIGLTRNALAADTLTTIQGGKGDHGMSASLKTAVLCAALSLLFSHPGAAQSKRGGAPPRKADQCVVPASAGEHRFSCSGLLVDAHVPRTCPATGCGLILEIHGDTGTGLLEDAHLDLRWRGDQAGYAVMAPTHPRRTWSLANDSALVNLTLRAIKAWQVDRARVHVTGFSRGGYVTWRLLCDHADLFASAAPAAAGAGDQSCFTEGRVPSRPVPILFLMGRTDHQVDYAAMAEIRDAAIAAYQAGPPRVLDSGSGFIHTRWEISDGGAIETFDHRYETAKNGPWSSALGHCIPGSHVDPHAHEYAFACQPPNGFVWGEEVIKFFRANPMR